MIIATVTVNANCQGRSFSQDVSVAGDNSIGFEPSIAAALAATLTVRGSNTAGSLTFTIGAGHGISTGDKFDLYFSGGKRIQVTAGTVAGAVVPFTVGTGDNLPILNSAITAMKADKELIPIVGNSIAAILIYAEARGTVGFYDAADALLKQYDMGAAGSSVWTSSMGITNPLAGVTAAYVLLSHDDSGSARVLRGILPYS